MNANLEDTIARHFTAKLGVASVQLEFRPEDYGFDNSLTVIVNGTPFDVFYTTTNEITLSCPA